MHREMNPQSHPLLHTQQYSLVYAPFYKWYLMVNMQYLFTRENKEYVKAWQSLMKLT